MNLVFSRHRIIRLLRVLMNRALGNITGNMESNGELFLLRRVLDFIQMNDEFVVFDVGANVGHWTNALLDIVEKQGGLTRVAVHCFEPSSFTFSELQATLAKHPMAQRVHVVNLGMNSTQGTVNLYINKNGAGTNSFYKRRTEGLDIIFDKTEVVQTTTLDIYCCEKGISHIDFLKIDVEGHELAVVQGATDMLKQQAIDYIQFEYGGTWIDSRDLFLDMYDLVTSFGYVIGKILPKGIELYDKYDQRLETFEAANFLACRPDLTNRFKQIKPWWMV